MKRLFLSTNMLFVACLLAVFSIFLTACSSPNSSPGSSQSTSESSSLVSPTDMVIIDVRSPSEFNEGTLPGAVNINVESPDFVEQISVLDKSKTYNVFCRSGRRSAIAVDVMKNNGFSNVNDLGSLDAAAGSLNLDIVIPTPTLP